MLNKEEKKYIALAHFIDFAIERKLTSFKLDGFEFNLSGTDPKQQELESLRQEVEQLKQYVNKLMLKEGLKKVG